MKIWRRLIAELHVDVLGLELADRRADADAGVVDEHVEAAEALAVRGDDLLDLLLVGDVDGQRLDLVALRSRSSATAPSSFSGRREATVSA